MAAEIINLNDYRDPWLALHTSRGLSSTVQMYFNTVTGELDIVQTNDEGEAISTSLPRLAVEMHHASLGFLLERLPKT